MQLTSTVKRNWQRTSSQVTSQYHAVLAEADKAFMQQHIVEVPRWCSSTRRRGPTDGVWLVLQVAMGIDNKPMLKVIAQAVVHICHAEFPDKWPALLAMLETNLRNVKEMQRVNNVRQRDAVAV